MEKLRALHIASFNGNIGDIANHLGFRSELSKYTGLQIEYTNCEIRNFYHSWGGIFDDDFIKYANSYDLIIFGGGGFFELKWDYSKSGTTIDLGVEDLGKFEKPVLFNGLGVSLAKGASNSAIKKFYTFLEYLVNRNLFFVTVRNDGSYELIRDLYGVKISNRILRIPDGGFFYQPNKMNFAEIEEGCTNIAINIAGDMPEIRFNRNSHQKLSREEFIEKIVWAIVKILSLDEKNRIVFIPHIFQDYDVIYQIMARLPDKIRRTKITCAPYLNGLNTRGQEIFDLYSQCDLTIGMRYHANVCNIGMNRPCIGICTYSPHIKLFEDIGLQEMCIPGNLEGFEIKLVERVEEILKCPEKFIQMNAGIMKILKLQNEEYCKKIKKWLDYYWENQGIGGENERI